MRQQRLQQRLQPGPGEHAGALKTQLRSAAEVSLSRVRDDVVQGAKVQRCRDVSRLLAQARGTKWQGTERHLTPACTASPPSRQGSTQPKPGGATGRRIGGAPAGPAQHCNGAAVCAAAATGTRWAGTRWRGTSMTQQTGKSSRIAGATMCCASMAANDAGVTGMR